MNDRAARNQYFKTEIAKHPKHLVSEEAVDFGIKDGRHRKQYSFALDYLLYNKREGCTNLELIHQLCDLTINSLLDLDRLL